jgi:hypothetical protein
VTIKAFRRHQRNKPARKTLSSGSDDSTNINLGDINPPRQGGQGMQAQNVLRANCTDVTIVNMLVFGSSKQSVPDISACRPHTHTHTR